MSKKEGIYLMDCKKGMKLISDNTIDACITDPPYGLQFMGKEWDNLWRNKDALILDPFLGSGTTGIACRNLNRRFIGFEKENEYYEIAINRISKEENQLKLNFKQTMQFYQLQAFIDLEFFINLKDIQILLKGRTAHDGYLIHKIISDNLGDCEPLDYINSVKLTLEGKSRNQVISSGITEGFVRKSVEIYFFKRRMYFGEKKDIKNLTFEF